MAQVMLENITKVFSGNVTAVNDINLSVQDKQFIVLVGPSGCGKSTLLRTIAGLETPSKGNVIVGDKVVTNVPPKDRDIAMVFQNYALYPHMSVFKNMAFALQLRKFPKAEIMQRVRKTAEILGIEPLLDRKPKALSGGQRQRVAVGRAIVRNPKAFLFDEPLSNLDAKMRVQMRTEISKLHIRLQATMIYVTHDQVEAMTMGDKIVVMKHGVIQQISDPITLYEKPVNKFVAGFIGSPPMNFLDGRLIKKDNSLFFDEGRAHLRVVDDMMPRLLPYINKKIIFGIRPENIYDKLFVGDTAPENTLTATVEIIEPMGFEVYLYLNTGKHSFIARVSAHDKAAVNQDIELVFNMSNVHFFDPKTEKVIV